MSNIEIKVVDQQLTFTNVPVIASGGREEDIITFSFDSTWDGFGKSCVFFHENYPDNKYDVVIVDNKVTIPFEATMEHGKFYIGIVGAKGSTVKTSQIIWYMLDTGVYEAKSRPANEDIYMQILQIAKNLLDRAVLEQQVGDAEFILPIHTINDSRIANDSTWSSLKIDTEIDNKIEEYDDALHSKYSGNMSKNNSYFNYYIDAENGDDSRTGIGYSESWRSFEPVYELIRKGSNYFRICLCGNNTYYIKTAWIAEQTWHISAYQGRPKLIFKQTVVNSSSKALGIYNSHLNFNGETSFGGNGLDVYTEGADNSIYFDHGGIIAKGTNFNNLRLTGLTTYMALTNCVANTINSLGAVVRIYDSEIGASRFYGGTAFLHNTVINASKIASYAGCTTLLTITESCNFTVSGTCTLKGAHNTEMVRAIYARASRVSLLATPTLDDTFVSLNANQFSGCVLVATNERYNAWSKIVSSTIINDGTILSKDLDRVSGQTETFTVLDYEDGVQRTFNFPAAFNSVPKVFISPVIKGTQVVGGKGGFGAPDNVSVTLYNVTKNGFTVVTDNGDSDIKYNVYIQYLAVI